MWGACWASRAQCRLNAWPPQAGSGLRLGPDGFPPHRACPARLLSSGWRQEVGKRQGFRKPDMFPTSDPQNSTNHTAEGGKPTVRGGE